MRSPTAPRREVLSLPDESEYLSVLHESATCVGKVIGKGYLGKPVLHFFEEMALHEIIRTVCQRPSGRMRTFAEFLCRGVDDTH